YGIIQEHKGWINVYSEQGKGSTFKIYLPFNEKYLPEKLSVIQVKAPELRGNGERILIVEDDPFVRALTEKSLSTVGYQVECVSTAEGALKRFEECESGYSLVISDVILPQKNGAELVAELLKKNPKLPAILCSGYSGERIRDAGIHSGDFFFLEKPFLISDLLNLVHSALRLQSN
ncbi:MAG: response regulator, partial [Pontiellaceae bacterium]|nr:response regulator [Pontiellaceae bacterium]